MAEGREPNILDAIQELKGRDPYIVVASGDRYRIEAPENLVQMMSEFFYAYPKSDRFVLIRKNQIVAVERNEEKRPRRRKAS
jgi:hypothetical protein